MSVDSTEQFHNFDWNEAIETLSNIIELEPHYKDVSLLLKEARKRRRLEEDYQWVSKKFKEAARTNRETDWLEVVDLLQDLVARDPQYKMVGPRLEQAVRRSRFLECYRKGNEYLYLRRWRKAIKFLEQASDLQSQDSYLADKCFDLQDKLNEARAKQNAWIASFLTYSVVPGIILAFLVAIFQNQIAGVGDYIWGGLLGQTTQIDKIEVWMNDGILNFEQLPTLIAGEEVELRVIVIDVNRKIYSSDDLVCTWSVAPLGVKDVGIDTDLCKTLYVPSREFSTQTVLFEVEGLEQQFMPTDPILLTFKISN